MTRRISAMALAVALCGLIAAPALAQNTAPAAAAKPKPKTPEGATVTVLVTNSRKTDLVELAAESGSASWKRVLGALKTGAHASAQLPKTFNCRFDLHGTFANGESMEASDVDVCAQKTLNLTD